MNAEINVSFGENYKSRDDYKHDADGVMAPGDDDKVMPSWTRPRPLAKEDGGIPHTTRRQPGEQPKADEVVAPWTRLPRPLKH